MSNTDQNEILRRLEEISLKIDETEEDRKAEKIDYFIAILLGIATILGAWAAYCSSIWGGNSATNYNKANFAVSEHSTAYLEALQSSLSMDLGLINDDLMYMQLQDAAAQNSTIDMEYFRMRMSDDYAAMLGTTEEEYYAAMEAWLTKLGAEVEQLDTIMATSIEGIANAKKMQEEADVQNGHGDAFTFVTVLFTITLFFGGMAAVSKNLKIKMIYSAAAIASFIYSVISMFMIPFP